MTDNTPSRSVLSASMIGVQLAGVVFLPAIVGGALLLGGVALTPLAWLPVIGLLSMVAREQAGRSFSEAPWKVALAAQLAAAVVALTLFFAAGRVLDTSWDGQAYHVRAVLALSEGWNPVWGAPLRHYLVDFLPKSAWVVEALVFLGTGSMEAAKGINLVMIAGAFALWYGAAAEMGLGRRWALMVALLTAANPIALNQSLTFYVDGLVASTVSVVAAVALLWWRTGHRLWLGLMVVGSAFLANLKFNGLAMAGVSIAFLLPWVRIKAAHRLRGLMAAAAALTVCAGVQGVNPYLTNTLRHGHPLHPLMGGGLEPGIELIYSRNPDFLGQSPPLRLLHSIGARATNDSEEWPRWKIPLTFDIEELGAFTDADTRIGGWGPLFSGCLLLSALITVWPSRQPGFACYAMIQGLLWLSVLPAEQSFWARYSPHLWLIPVLSLLSVARARSEWLRILGGALALTMALNVMLAGTPALSAALVKDAAARRQLEAMAASSLAGDLPVHFGLFAGLQRRLTEAGVAYRASQRLDCPQPAELIASTARYCLADGGSPRRAQTPLEVLDGLLSLNAWR